MIYTINHDTHVFQPYQPRAQTHELNKIVFCNLEICTYEKCLLMFLLFPTRLSLIGQLLVSPAPPLWQNGQSGQPITALQL